MPMFRFIRRPRFVVSATIALLVAAFVTYRATRPTSYQVYERVRVGDGIEEVTRRLGEPTDSHQTTNGTDYLFAVTGHPDYPRMLGVPFPVLPTVNIYETPGYSRDVPPGHRASNLRKACRPTLRVANVRIALLLQSPHLVAATVMLGSLGRDSSICAWRDIARRIITECRPNLFGKAFTADNLASGKSVHLISECK